jgi:hypothetical protein
MDRMDFQGYVDAAKTNKLRSWAGVRAQMANRLSGFPPTDGLTGTAVHEEGSNWPVLLVRGFQRPDRAGHPLLKEQESGIGMDRVLDLFAVYGHDMKAAAK